MVFDVFISFFMSILEVIKHAILPNVQICLSYE